MNRKWITRADLYLLAGVLICVLTVYLITKPRMAGECVSVYVGNEQIAEFSLSDAPPTYEISTEKGSVTLLFDGEGVSVIRSDCPDAVCVRTGRVTRAGESIVCAPLGVCVTVEGGTLDGVTG